MVYKAIIVRDGEIIFIAEEFDRSNVLITISIAFKSSRVKIHVIKIVFSNNLRRFIPLKFDSTM